MITKYSKNGSETVYNDDEWNFIENLPENCKHNILRGLATPYDYGYIGECLGMWEATPEEQEEIDDILAELGF